MVAQTSGKWFEEVGGKGDLKEDILEQRLRYGLPPLRCHPGARAYIVSKCLMVIRYC